MIEDTFGLIFKKFNRAEESLKRLLVSLKSRISETKQKILSLEKLVLTYSPEKQLKLGYSIVYADGTLVKEVGQLKTGQQVDITVSDGLFESEVKKIYKK